MQEDVPVEPFSPSSPSVQNDSGDQSTNNMDRLFIEQRLRQKIHVKHYGKNAGAIMNAEEAEKFGFSRYMNNDNIYAPFSSEIDWDIAEWIKLRGPSSAAVNELLKIPQVC